MDVSCEYISIACNRTPKSLKWSPVNETVAYGAGSSVAVADFGGDAPKVEYTLHGHTARVNCVHFLTSRSREENKDLSGNELITGSSDSAIKIWTRVKGKFQLAHTLVGHEGPVTTVAGTCLTNGGDNHHGNLSAILVSASVDSTLRVWLRREPAADFELCQTVSFGRGFVLAVDLYLLKNAPLLACGGENCKVSLYLWQDKEFVKVLSLSGHEDWVRDVQFAQTDSGNLLLASCSQDTYVRLWCVAPKHTGERKDQGELKLKENTFTHHCHGNANTYTVCLEAVLIGHEDWVYSVDWHPVIMEGDSPVQPLCLLTTSMDKTMIIWKPDPESGMWTEHVRVGEVGGNTLGLYGGVFSNTGTRILAHGYQGGFHIWKQPSKKPDMWEHQVPLSGHFGAVTDLCWEPRGTFLLSVSSDQTCRLHAPWVRDNIDQVTWHEVARPQVHGYDMHCVTMTTSGQFVSGADEKVLRVFDAPQNFIDNISNISRVNLQKVKDGVPLGASVPALGLSNKAVFTEADPKEKAIEGPVKNLFSDHQLPYFVPMSLQGPPVEENLLQNTLWPEVQKLYGHGFELYAVDSTPQGDLVASASKATKQEYAAIRLWDVASWKQVGVLSHHALTVTQLAFSHDGNNLLAVSRDRCWSLWKRTKKEGNICGFVLEAHVDKSHKSHLRIIWSCSWSPDDLCFFTASRDKKTFVWSRESCIEGARDCGNGWKMAANPLESSEPVTAVSIAPVILEDASYLVAIGLESGAIFLYTFKLSVGKWLPFGKVEDIYCHSSSVKRLSWQPVGVVKVNALKSRVILLASSCTDGSVRLHKLKL